MKKIMTLLFGFSLGFYIGISYIGPYLYSIGIDLW